MYYKYFYLNGNYVVSCTDFGKTREYTTLRIGEDFEPDFPDSIDLKITNKCSHGCSFCHESSGPLGKSFNLENTKKMLSQLPGGVEIAIGGGNIFDCFDDFFGLLEFCKSKDFFARATVNILDLLNFKKQELILRCFGADENHFFNSKKDNLLGALGISVSRFIEVGLFEENKIHNFNYYTHGNFVFHIILGIYPIEEFMDLLDYCLTNSYGILILGLKQFGRAANIGEPKDIEKWKQVVSKTIYESRISSSKLVLGLDNLAIEQLDIKSKLTEREWKKLYLGNEFSHSMYIDAVEETFAPTSRSPLEERVKWCDTGSVVEYFKNNHKPWN